MSEGPATDSPTTRRVIAALEPLLGRFTARKAVELSATQCGTTLVDLDSRSIADLCERLRPVLRTLLGAPAAGEVLSKIAQRAKLEEHDG